MKINKPKITIYEDKNINDIDYLESISNYRFTKTTNEYKKIKDNTFDSCIFENIDFTNIELINIDLIDIIFFNCDLSNKTFDNKLINRVVFKNCKMLGTSFINSALKDCSYISVFSKDVSSFIDTYTMFNSTIVKKIPIQDMEKIINTRKQQIPTVLSTEKMKLNWQNGYNMKLLNMLVEYGIVGLEKEEVEQLQAVLQRDNIERLDVPVLFELCEHHAEMQKGESESKQKISKKQALKTAKTEVEKLFDDIQKNI